MNAMMAVSNHGRTIHSIDPKRPKADLLRQSGGTSAQRAFRDTEAGDAEHIGYVVSHGRGTEPEWFTFYTVDRWVR